MGNPIKLAARHIQGGLIPAFVLGILTALSAALCGWAIGLLKLRGAAPSRIWALVAQQSALPMVTGTVLGWLLGYFAAAGLARSLSGPAGTAATDPVSSLWLSIAMVTGDLLSPIWMLGYLRRERRNSR